MKSAQVKRYKIIRQGTVIAATIAVNEFEARQRAWGSYGSSVTVREDLFYKPKSYNKDLK